MYSKIVFSLVQQDGEAKESLLGLVRSHIPSTALYQVSGDSHIYMHHTDNALEMLWD